MPKRYRMHLCFRLCKLRVAPLLVDGQTNVLQKEIRKRFDSGAVKDLITDGYHFLLGEVRRNDRPSEALLGDALSLLCGVPWQLGVSGGDSACYSIELLGFAMAELVFLAAATRARLIPTCLLCHMEVVSRVSS
jgi:hypothetical protein